MATIRIQGQDALTFVERKLVQAVAKQDPERTRQKYLDEFSRLAEHPDESVRIFQNFDQLVEFYERLRKEIGRDPDKIRAGRYCRDQNVAYFSFYFGHPPDVALLHGYRFDGSLPVAADFLFL